MKILRSSSALVAIVARPDRIEFAQIEYYSSNCLHLIMLKFTRSNKINHYHDSKTMRAALKQGRADKRRKNPTRLAAIIANRIDTSIVNCSGQSAGGQCSDSSSSLDADSASSPLEAMEPRNGNRNSNNNNKIGNISGQILISNRNWGSSSSTLKQLAFFAFLILATMIVCLEVRQVSSLNCYHCSSVDNPECDESFTGRANFTDTDCEKHIGRPAKVCRKIVQYIEDKKVVIRSCGYIDEHEGGKEQKAMCYKRSGTFAIMMESCNCYEDNCNHSASLVPSKSLLFTLIVASCGLLSALAVCLSSQVTNIRPLKSAN